MAINKQIQFLRNTNKIYTSRTEAVNAIETLVTGASTKGKILDGQPILARYKDTDGKVKTVTASVYKASNGSTQVTYYDEHVDEVYVGSGTPPSTTKLAVDVTENMVSIVQNTGTGTKKTIDVMSKKAVTDALSTKVGKTDITQSTGTSETAVMSQNAVSDALSTKVDKTELDSYATKEYVQTNAPQETKESIEEKLGAWLEEDGGEADGDVYTKAESDARYLRWGFEYCGLMEWDGTNEVKIYEMKFDLPKREVLIFGKCKYDASNKGQFKITITNGNNIIGVSYFSSSSNAEELFHIHNVCGNYVCDINNSNNNIVPNSLKRCYMADDILLAIKKDVGMITNLEIQITTDLVRIDGIQKWYVFAKN